MRAAPRWLPVIEARRYERAVVRANPVYQGWEAEFTSQMDRMRRDLSVFLYSATFRERVEPFRLDEDTLVRRALYGGRKGRRALQRLGERRKR